MSSHKANSDWRNDDNLDALIRWALHDSVANAEPSPEVWERIRQRVGNESAKAAPVPGRRRFSRQRAWAAWLRGAGAEYPVPGDPRFAWQRRLHAFDMRAPLSVIRIIEGRMPLLRFVA